MRDIVVETQERVRKKAAGQRRLAAFASQQVSGKALLG